jgi:hypothetical protein
MATLIGQSCLALVAQALHVDYICVQRCLSTVSTVANLCGSMATRLKIEKSTGSPSFEELPRTLQHRARYGRLYHQVLVFCIASDLF